MALLAAPTEEKSNKAARWLLLSAALLSQPEAFGQHYVVRCSFGSASWVHGQRRPQHSRGRARPGSRGRQAGTTVPN